MDQQNRNMLPVIALRGLCITPGLITHVDINRKQSLNALNEALKESKMFLAVTQKRFETEEVTEETVFSVGCVVSIIQVTQLPNKVTRVIVQGKCRSRIYGLEGSTETFYQAEHAPYVLIPHSWNASEQEARSRILREALGSYLTLQTNVSKEMLTVASNAGDLSEIIHVFAAQLPLAHTARQRYLEVEDEESLYELLREDLLNEIEVLKIKNDLNRQLKEQVSKNQKEYILREQMHFIRKELGKEDEIPDAEAFKKELENLDAPDHVKEKINKEIARLRNVEGSSSESANQRVYIETLLSMPWNKAGEDATDLDRAEAILERDHYGLEKVKERILEYLAVRALTKESESTIICLAGPPGTGKTSIAQSVAEALNKKYVRICLGGVRDEAEIRGHRRTYIGAMPGRIAEALKQVGENNPLMLLDEIDKLASDYKGDPASALLEVLDSQQNKAFRDHYLEIPLDLSKVCFIATANNVATIPRPLLDRMEVIEVNSYTSQEKFHIGKKHLWKKQLKKNGLTGKQLTISDSGLRKLIQEYTKEAGVRELERKIGTLCRKTAREIIQHDATSVKITDKNLENYLGKPRYVKEKAGKKDEIGIVHGLAWTSVGGSILGIEVNVMPGKGEVILTGQMGDVMKESAGIGLSYIRSKGEEENIPETFFKEHDIHIHIPEGAVPKDGPSAGITMACAMLSAIKEIPVKGNVAMTGEITLRGKVLPVGGLKEKILAAKNGGIRKVLVPAGNEKDIRELEEEVVNGIELFYVENMDDVKKHAFATGKGKKNENKKC